MMSPRLRLIGNVSSAFLVLALAGCGGSKQPAASPSSPASASPSASSAPEAPPAPAPEASASAAPAAPASDDSGLAAEEKPSQPPIDLMTQTDEAFVINFDNSDIGAKADKACKSSNPARKAKCRKRKRSKFLADVLQFKKKGKKIIFKIYKRKGTRVTLLSTDEVKLTQKSDNTVTVEVTHKGRMPRLLFTHRRKFEVTVPNDYSIRLHEPKYGKLVYDGKVDVLGK